MSDNRPASDPEAEGLPSTADDDSTAYDEVESAREADGPSPAALPADHPIASLDYGTTPAEAGRQEPLDDRLAREEPDDVELPGDPVSPADVGVLDVPAPGDYSGPDPELVDDPDVLDVGTTGEDVDQVGRLVGPDEGTHRDVEDTAIASDPGSAGGGLTAEEAAMHEER